jgi:hypothetical protein
VPPFFKDGNMIGSGFQVSVLVCSCICSLSKSSINLYTHRLTNTTLLCIDTSQQIIIFILHNSTLARLHQSSLFPPTIPLASKPSTMPRTNPSATRFIAKPSRRPIIIIIVNPILRLGSYLLAILLFVFRKGD